MRKIGLVAMYNLSDMLQLPDHFAVPHEIYFLYSLQQEVTAIMQSFSL